MNVPDSTRLGIVEVDEDHPLLWSEQMMPILPICRVPDADRAIYAGHRRRRAATATPP